MNHEAARLYREDRREYARRVKLVIERSLEIEEEENSTNGKINFYIVSSNKPNTPL